MTDESSYHLVLLVRIGLGLILLSMAACQPGLQMTGLDSNSVPIDNEAAAGKSQIAVKNYEQIFETMVSVTGISVTNEIRDIYTASKGSLPADNTIENFSASQMLAISNLASSFCERVVPSNGSNMTFFTGTSFTTINNNSLHNPRVYLTSARQIELAQHYMTKFWGPELTPTPFRQTAQSELLGVITDALSELPSTQNGDAQLTRTIMRSLCAVTLASPQVILF